MFTMKMMMKVSDTLFYPIRVYPVVRTQKPTNSIPQK